MSQLLTTGVIQGSLLNQYFKITVDTTKAGSANDTFVLPLDGSSTYNFKVFWGDGTSETVTNNTNVTHTYSVPGEYQISITGIFPHIYFNNSGDKLKLISIDAWGKIKWGSFSNAFYGCSNMNTNNAGCADISNVESFSNAFHSCSSLTFLDVSSWDTSKVLSFSSVFLNCTNLNNLDVSGWNVSKNKNFSYSFYNCGNLSNLDVSSWNTAEATTFAYCFVSCAKLKGNFSSIDIDKVTNLVNMFFNCDLNEEGTTTNYDNLLVSLKNQAETLEKTGLNFHGGNSKYSATGQAARDILTTAVESGGYGWTITDGGLAS